MDARLAELYGTNQPDEADLEKLAAAEFADGLAEDEELDLDDVDEETLEQLAQEVVDGEGQEKVAEGEEEEEPTDEEEEEPDEEQVKVAEADQLGRIMAHAYVQELRGIEKEAAKKPPPSFLQKAKKFGGKVGAGIEKAERKAEKKVGAGAKWAFGKASKGAKAVAGSKAGKAALKGGGKALRFAGKHRGKLGLAAAAGGAAAAAGKKKAASATPALDELATQRANEILAENGLIESEGQEQGEETESAKYDVLAAAVEQKAYQMLEDAGYRRVEE